MKTNLTGRDLLIMHNIIMERLRICNLNETHREQCIELENKITDILDGVEMEVKTKGKKNG